MKALLPGRIISFFLLFLIFFASNQLLAQESNPVTIKNLVESKQFAFRAQSALPLTGAIRQLTYGYDIQLKGDTLISYLPYFGRSYAPVMPGEEGFKFTSVHFDYKAKAKKKGGWDITITPKDTKEVRQMNISISGNGYASLQVSSNNRQSISYNGYITGNK